MSDRRLQGCDNSDSSVSRRTFVKAAGASGATVSLAGCIYGGSGSSNAVVWEIDANAYAQVGGKIKQLLRDNGVDADIKLQPAEKDSGKRRDNYISLLNAGEASPDLFLMDNGWLNNFIQKGLVGNLSKELDNKSLSTVKNKYFKSFTETARDPKTGDLYGIPLFPDYPTMQYRKDYARQAGYGEKDFKKWATEPMTWKKWAEVTQKITKASKAEYGYATQWDIYEGTSCCTWNEVMSSFGGAYFGGRDNLFGPVGDRPITVDEPEFIKGLEMMRTFVATEHDKHTNDDYPLGLAPSEITSWKEEDARQAILSGRVAMQRNWPYAIKTNLSSDKYDLSVEDYGAMPMPYAVSEDKAAQPGTGGTTAALGGWHIALNPNSQRKEEALQVLRAAMKDDFNLGLLDVWGWLPPKPHLFNTKKAESIEPMGNYMDTLRVAGENAMPRPVTAVWSNESSVIAQEVNSAVAGDKTPSAAAANLQKQLKSIEQQG